MKVSPVIAVFAGANPTTCLVSDTCGCLFTTPTSATTWSNLAHEVTGKFGSQPVPFVLRTGAGETVSSFTELLDTGEAIFFVAQKKPMVSAFLVIM